MTDPAATTESQANEALNRDIDQRLKFELGTLLQKILILQAQNAFLLREVERLSAPVSPG